MDKITVGVLTVSDRCARKEAVDESGPNLVKMIGDDGVLKNGTVAKVGLVPDTAEDIGRVLSEWSNDDVHLILTTGGTGVAERDVTPETTAALLERTIPGISHLMFKHSSEVTPLAALSRGVAGVRGKTLIINLPGSKKASRECLEAVAGVIPHAVDLIRGNQTEVGRVHASLVKRSSVAVDNVAGRKRQSAYPCVSVKEAQDAIEKRIYLLRKEKIVRYDQALGHVLAQDVIARDDLPPFDASIKDGYAVLSTDKMLERNVMAVSQTGGSLPEVEVYTGHCVRVSTGAAIPPGADAVVQVEDTVAVAVSEDEMEEVKIKLKALPRRGQDIREKGSDFQMGEMLLPTGTYLDSPALGLVAAAGVTSLRVFEKPLVAVISTGDELLNPEDNLTPGKVRDSNRITLLSLLKEENFQAVDGGIVSDNPDALLDALERGFKMADVVVTTGSMSMGERDYLKEVLVSDLRADICFGRVHMKPGKPTSFAVVMHQGKPKLWFGLPGNPASALVTSHLFLLPALRKISGLQNIYPMTVKATLEQSISSEDRPHYVRAVVKYDENRAKWTAKVIGNQRSSRIGSCVNANGFVEVPEGPQPVSKNPYESVTLLKAFLIGKSYT